MFIQPAPPGSIFAAPTHRQPESSVQPPQIARGLPVITRRPLVRDFIQWGYLKLAAAKTACTPFGFTLDTQLSVETTKVFFRDNSSVIVRDTLPKRLVVVCRGSASATDWLVEDTAILFGLASNTPRIKETKRITAEAESKYGMAADAIGHSLGGRLAELSGAHGQIVTYNKAVSITDVGKKIDAKQTDFRTKGDAVSLMAVTQAGGRLRYVDENINETTATLYRDLDRTATMSGDPYAAAAAKTIKAVGSAVAAHKPAHLRVGYMHK